jgi:hypothetical protein
LTAPASGLTALGTTLHLPRDDVVARRVPWTLQVAVLDDLPLAERGEQVAAAIGNRERLARAHADGEAPCGVSSTTATCELPRS